MSTMIRKILLLSLALVLPFALLGCAEEEETLTSEQIDQIVIGAANAVAEAQTYKFDMDMFMTMAVVGGTDPGTMTVGANATGVIDSVNQEMETIMDMVMSVAEEDEQQMGMEMYVVDEWLYMKMSIPEIGEEWVKMELTPAMWQTQQQIEQTMELLQTATEVKFLGSEAVDGVDCYVFDIIPDMEKLAEYLAQQQSMLGVGLDVESLVELFANMSVSIKEWIAEDSLLLTKSTAHMLVEVTPEDVGATSEDFDRATMDLSTVMTVYGYNQPVSIELPEEALEAPEISMT
jgi:hypothetical protein